MEYKYDKDSFMRPEQVLYRRCGEKAAELFPYNTDDQVTWTNWCWNKCRDRRVSPQQLKDERTGKSNSTQQQRPIKPFYY